MKTQSGFSSMVILIATILVVIIFWELSRFTDIFTTPPITPKKTTVCPTKDPADCYDTDEGIGPAGSGGAPLCKTGNPKDCNDSNDNFIWTE